MDWAGSMRFRRSVAGASMLASRLDGVDAKEVAGRALEAGLIVNPIGNDTLRFLPPLVIGEAEIDEALEILGRTLL